MSWKEELDSLESDKRWDASVSFLKEAVALYPNDVVLQIRAIYLLLNLLLEEDYSAFDLKHDDLATMLKKCFDDSYERFKDSPKYLFFIGYFTALAEWYFGQEDLALSHQMLKKAVELEPDNPLYEWGYMFATGQGDGTSLCKRLISNQSVMHALDSNGSPGEYISAIIRSSCESEIHLHQDLNC